MEEIEKIRIIFVASSLSGGGAERMMINIINSLSLTKYDILLINTSYENRSIQLKKGIKFYNFNKVHANNAFRKLYIKIRYFSPSYVFSTSTNFGYMLVLLKILLLNKFKIIIRIAVPPSENSVNNFRARIVHFLSKITFSRIDQFIAQTEFSKQDMILNYKIKPYKIEVIRNIIDEKFLLEQGNMFIPIEFQNSKYNVVAAGALYSIKGFDLLIQAFTKICLKCDNACLYILGKERYEHGYEKYLQNLINELNLSKKVFLLGYKENPYPYYKNADLFVLSSRTEGFPNVVLESLFFHTPVIATDCVDFSGIIIEGVNGYIVKKNNINALYEGISMAYCKLRQPFSFILEKYNYENIFV